MNLSMEQDVTIRLTLTDEQASSLAQFVKRVGWSEMRSCAINESEAYLIRDAIERVQRALREAGYAPR